MNELLDRLRAAWDNFSPRERILISASGGLVLLAILIFLVVIPIVDSGARAGDRSRSVERELEAMIRLRSQYDDVNTRLASVERRIQTNRNRQNILTLLESLASASAVKIDSMEQRQAADNDKYRETRVEVTLKSVTLTQTVEYLANVESSENQLSIKGMRLKTRPDNTALLDVSFTVSSFEPI